MTAAEFAELCEDIEQNGQREPVTLFEGKILDGRNRYNACRELGLEVWAKEWDHVGSPLAFVISHNLRRRHLDESQRALVASRIASYDSPGRPAKNAPIGANISQADAAKLLNVSRQSVSRATKVQKEGVNELVERVESGEMSVAAAADFVTKHPSKAKQSRILKKSRGKVVHLASRLKVESKLRKARTTMDVCMTCNGDLPATEENFVADLEAKIAALRKKPGGAYYARYLQSVLEEINELNIADETLPISEQILAAIRQGNKTKEDILKFTGLSEEDCRFALDNLEQHGTIRAVPQGGKTNVARGRRKTLWEIVEKKTVARGHFDAETDEDDDDEADYAVAAGTGTAFGRELSYEPAEMAA